MTLRVVDHERRLGSAAEAEAFLRALRWFGTSRVSLVGLQTTEMKKIIRIVDAIDPRDESRLDFEGGSLGTRAREALERLVQKPFDYLDIGAPGSNLRLWPARYAWVDSERPFVGHFPDAEVTITTPPAAPATKMNTTSPATAAKAFLGVTGDVLTSGFINGVRDAAKPALVDFVRETGAKVHASIEVDVRVARALSELFRGEKLEWRGEDMTLLFPEGVIRGSFVSGDVDSDEANTRAWTARADKALARAGLK